MILPVIAYGDAVLRKVAKPIEKDDKDLKDLIANMWETMYNANGVGLAAPQIGKSIRLFIVDTDQLKNDAEEDEKPYLDGFKKAFINPTIISTSGKPYAYREGCLSIPDIREDVIRDETVEIKYYDENFKQHKDTFNSVNARVILHEYDHIEGKLFLDYLKPLKKQMLKRQLKNISTGKVKSRYKMKFSSKK